MYSVSPVALWDLIKSILAIELSESSVDEVFDFEKVALSVWISTW